MRRIVVVVGLIMIQRNSISSNTMTKANKISINRSHINLTINKLPNPQISLRRIILQNINSNTRSRTTNLSGDNRSKKIILKIKHNLNLNTINKIRIRITGKVNSTNSSIKLTHTRITRIKAHIMNSNSYRTINNSRIQL